MPTPIADIPLFALNAVTTPDGHDQQLRLEAFTLPETSFTFEVAIETAGTLVAGQTLAQLGMGDADRAGFAVVPTGEGLRVVIGGEALDVTVASDAFTSEPGRLSVTYDGETGQAAAYLNGEAIGTGTLSVGLAPGEGAPLSLGTGGGLAAPEVAFGDLRVWSNARTAAEVAAAAGESIDAPAGAAGLSAYWTATASGLASALADQADIAFVDHEVVANYQRASDADREVDTGDPVVDELIEGLLMKSTYAEGEVLTYSFELSWALAGEEGYGAISDGLTARYRQLLDDFTDLTGVRTLEVDQSYQDVNLYFATSEGTSTAYVSSHRGGIMHVHKETHTEAELGGYVDHLILHEMGHALGLRHGHDDDALPEAYRGHAWSVMSYTPAPGATPAFVDSHGPETWMLADVLAIQHQFGANFETASGDTTYSWNATGETFVDGEGQGATKNDQVFRTIWDGDGHDTYDLSVLDADLSIDLRPGRFTSFGEDRLATFGRDADDVVLRAPGNIANAYLFEGDERSLIEDAVAGAGDDVLVGNRAANTLIGGLGADLIEGGAGGDLLYGDVMDGMA